MKATISNTTKKITSTEQVAGEAQNFTSVVKSRSGTVIHSGPLVPPPEPPEPVLTTVMLTPASITTKAGEAVPVSCSILDQNGQPIQDASATFASSDPAVATFDGVTVRAIKAGNAVVSVTAGGKSDSTSVAVADAVVIPPPPQPMSKVVGPYPDYLKASAANTHFARYLNAWKGLEETRWLANAPDSANWANTNYYDRANIDYAFATITGNATLMSHAHQQALNYRKNYLEAASYMIQPHWSMMDGVAAHFLATGDEMSRIAVGRVADLFCGLTYRDSIGSRTATDNRVQARYLVAVLLAYHIGAKSTGVPAAGIPGGRDWAFELRRALPLILGTQDADGGWRLSECGDGGSRVYHPFTTGLLLDALARYYDTFEQDARIVTAITKGAEFLWNNAWLPAEMAFKYIERVCPNEGGPGPSPDLNGILLRGFSFAYRMGKDPLWRERTMQILIGSFNAWLSPDKQINQTYTAGYRAIADLMVP